MVENGKKQSIIDHWRSGVIHRLGLDPRRLLWPVSSGPEPLSSAAPVVRDVAFLHIPKTAGTALRGALARSMPDAVRAFAYDGRLPSSLRPMIALSPDEAANATLWRTVRFENRNKRILFGGHVTARHCLAAFHPASVVVFLRDPVERILSAYHHFVVHKGYSGSLAEFYEADANVNTLTRYLTGLNLETAGFVGVTEMLPDLLEPLGQHFGVKLAVANTNKARGQKPMIDQWTRSRIMRLNDADVQLYQHVKKNIESYTDFRSRNRFSVLEAEGHVQQQGEGLFSGWVVTKERGRLAEIDIWAGDTLLARTFADRFDIQNWGGTTENRRWCFVVHLSRDLVRQATVHFSFSGSQVPLRGSPIAPAGY